MTVVLSSARRRSAYATGAFGMAINAMVQFLLPLRAVELGIGIGVIGVLLAAKAVTESVASVPLGGFMDRVGTRRAFLIGTAATAFVGLGFLLATSVASLFVLQMLLGVVRPLGWVGAQSYVAGLRTGSDRAHDTGRFSFAANASQIVAPLLVGAVAQAFDARLGFAVLAAFGALFFVLGLTLPDAGRHGSTNRSAASFGLALRLLRLRDIQVAMLLTFARLFIPATWTSFFPLYLVTSGMPEAVAGSVVSAMAVTATVTALFSGRIARLGAPDLVTAGGLGVSALGVAMSPFIAGAPLAYIGAILVGVGQGISLPMLLVLVANGAPDEQRGLALGLRSSVNQMASAVAPLTVAPIIGAVGVFVGFPVAGGLVGLVLVGAVALRSNRARRSAPGSMDGADDGRRSEA